MPIKIFGVLSVLVLALAATVITGTGFTNSTSGQQKFTATLSGQDEVPPIVSEGTGMAKFTVMEDSIQYSLDASNIEGVTAAHIFSGIQGENGPVVVTLVQYLPATNQVSEAGFITADMLEGDMAGKQLSDLIEAMSNEETYVKVHTEENPDGEIRGQIMTSMSLVGEEPSIQPEDGGRVNWGDICRNPLVDSIITEPCETLTSPDGYTLTAEGQRVLGCLVGGALVGILAPELLVELKRQVGPAVDCG